MSIHRCDPTTDRHGGFDLLRLRPGPVHPSLDDLVVPSSPRSTISIPNLARTPDRHSPLQPRTPELKRSASLSLPAAWITGARHCTRRELRASALLLNLVLTAPSSAAQQKLVFKLVTFSQVTGTFTMLYSPNRSSKLHFYKCLNIILIDSQSTFSPQIILIDSRSTLFTTN